MSENPSQSKLRKTLPFTKGDQGREDMISRSVTIIKGGITQPMRQRVHTERRMMDHKLTDDATVDESTPVITPSQTGDQGWDTERHERSKPKELVVLEADEFVGLQVRDIGPADCPRILTDQHPKDMGPDQTLLSAIRVL